MPRKGRLLELITHGIQELLSPEGVTVLSPEEFYDDRGMKLGEIDVTLRGEWGAAKLFIGIECRNRPRSGPEGVAWIREILGKKAHLKVDKMIAVSSSGFTSQAMQLANEQGLDLIVVEDIESIDSVTWFTAMTFGLPRKFYDISGRVEILFQEGMIDDFTFQEIHLDPASFLLYREGSSQLLTIPEYILPEVEQFSSQLTIPVGQKVHATLEYSAISIDAVWDSRSYKIGKMIVPIQVWQEVFEYKAILHVHQRQADKEIVAMSGVTHVEYKDTVFKIVTIVTQNRQDPDDKKIRFEFFTEDNKPLNPLEIEPRIEGIHLFSERPSFWGPEAQE